MKERPRSLAPDQEFLEDERLEDALRPPQPGRRTLTMSLMPWEGAMPPAVQLAAAPAAALWDDLSGGSIHAVAAAGTRGAGGALPHLDAIQRAFGHHDVRGVVAHVGGAAAEAAGAIGAVAYAAGDHVAFADAPDVHLAAHEAAHVVQQRGGVRLSDGVGRRGDVFERHADEVADRVVRGESAEALLDQHAHRGAAGGPAVQMEEHPARAGETRAPAGGAWTEQQIRELVQRSAPPQVIEQIAGRDTENALAILASTQLWARVMMAHPRGRAVPASTREAMYSIVHRRLLSEDQYRQFFWVRFDIRFERVYDQDALTRGGDRTARPMPPWNPMVADRLWWQLDRLPAQDVSENQALEVIRTAVLEQASGEYHDANPGLPATERNLAVVREQTVQNDGRRPDGTLGQSDDEAEARTEIALEDTVRHEIGHAVQARLGGVADSWLQSTVQFTMQPASAENVTALIGRLGGFPESFTDAQRRTVVQIVCGWTTQQREWPAPVVGDGPRDDEQTLMAQMPQPVQQLGTWHSADRGSPTGYSATSLGREFLNRHYLSIGRLSERGMEVVTATNRNRAGYAPQEYFAECYAEYYADPAAATTPARRGGSLPGWIKQFFDQHVAAHPPREPARERGAR